MVAISHAPKRHNANAGEFLASRVTVDASSPFPANRMAAPIASVR